VREREARERGTEQLRESERDSSVVKKARDDFKPAIALRYFSALSSIRR